jgi:hypothetical protein
MYVIVTMLAWFIFFNFTHTCFAYDKGYVHPSINAESLKKSLTIDDVLVTLKSSTAGDSIKIINNINKWLREGGTAEDEPDARSRNHFHDPNKPWDQAGLKGDLIGDSSVYWAQNPNQDWSWNSAKDYYYQALAGADSLSREQSLSKTFRALGK